MYAYCLFCRSLRCSSVRRFCEATTSFKLIQPRIVQRKWVKGEETTEEHDFLPGYLFIYSDEPITDFHDFYRVNGVIRPLGYNDQEEGKDNMELTGADLRFALNLLDYNGVIDTVKVYRVGDRLTPARGMLAGLDGRIIRVDQHRKRLEMEFEFDQTIRRVWVGYDVVEEDDDLEISTLDE